MICEGSINQSRVALCVQSNRFTGIRLDSHPPHFCCNNLPAKLVCSGTVLTGDDDDDDDDDDVLTLIHFPEILPWVTK